MDNVPTNISFSGSFRLSQRVLLGGSQANGDFDAAPMLETVTLMIWGEEDRALGVELTRGTDELVSDLTLRYLPNVSHWVQQEAPGRVNEIVLAWMQGEPVPGNTRPGGSDGATE